MTKLKYNEAVKSFVEDHTVIIPDELKEKIKKDLKDKPLVNLENGDTLKGLKKYYKAAFTHYKKEIKAAFELTLKSIGEDKENYIQSFDHGVIGENKFKPDSINIALFFKDGSKYTISFKKEDYELESLQHSPYNLLHVFSSFINYSQIEIRNSVIEGLERNRNRYAKKTVRKPKTVNETDINTSFALENIYNEKPTLFTENLSEQDIQEVFANKSLAELSNHYGFLTDGILSYFNDYKNGERKTITTGNLVTESGETEKKYIIIKDTWTNFCEKSGANSNNYKSGLLKEIQADKFSHMGLINLNINKNDFRFTQESFLSYTLTYKSFKKINNLKNTEKEEAIDTIRLDINQHIFESLIKPKGTRGYIFQPDKLELKLRSVFDDESNKKELMLYCKNFGERITGKQYTSGIRAVYNLLMREELCQTDIFNGKAVSIISKPTKGYAQHCYKVSLQKNKTFRAKDAKEFISFALKVIQIMARDGADLIVPEEWVFSKNNKHMHIYFSKNKPIEKIRS